MSKRSPRECGETNTATFGTNFPTESNQVDLPKFYMFLCNVKTCTKAVECGGNKQKWILERFEKTRVEFYEKRRLVSVQRNKSVLDSVPARRKISSLIRTQSSHLSIEASITKEEARLEFQGRVPRCNIFTPTDFRITKKRDAFTRLHFTEDPRSAKDSKVN